MGHGYSSIFQFYINPTVKCDVQAAYLDEPSDTALMKALGNMSLTCDPLAPTRLSVEDARAIQGHPTVARLRQKRDAVTKALKEIRSSAEPWVDVKEKEGKLLELKREADADLRRMKKRLRDRAGKKAREKYFAENDTKELEEESDSSPDDNDEMKFTPTTYALEERARIAGIICRPPGDLTEPSNLDQRIELIRAMALLCSRREARRRTAASVSLNLRTEEGDIDSASMFPLECDSRQCLFCLGDKSLPMTQRVFCWSRPAKMMDHTENEHFNRFTPDSDIPCPHPRCRTEKLVLDGVLHFKSHALGVHKIKLRVPKAEPW